MSEFEIKKPYEPPPMKATQEQLKDNRVPLEYRDFCAHLLIPLNKCRRDNFYMPWACGDERHKYELCQYAGYKRRLLKQDLLKHQSTHE